MLNLKLVLLSFCFLLSFNADATLNNFWMDWEFVDNMAGDNPHAHEDICQCGTVYMRNTSVYNGNTPIGNQLLTGYYKIESLLPTLYTITTIPAADWVGNQVIAVNIPCHLSFTGSAINLRATHYGPGIGSGSTRDYGLYLNTHANPPVNAGGDITICNGSGTQLGASGATNYQWSPPTGLSATNVSNPFASPASTTMYTVTGSTVYTTYSGDPLTCSATDDVTISVNSGPSVNIGSNQYLCSNDPLPVLDAGASGRYNYSWYLNGNPISNAQTVNTGSFGYGTYSVHVTGANGCVTIATVLVVLDPSAGPNIDSDFNLTTSSSTINPSTVNFFATATTNYPENAWMLIQSDLTQANLGMLEYSISGNTFLPTQNFYPNNSAYIIRHYARSAPCSEWVSTSHWIAVSNLTSGSGSSRSANQSIEIPSSQEDLDALALLLNKKAQTLDQIEVFPNPSSGQFTVNLKDASAVTSIQVMDLTGRMIHSEENVTQQMVDLDLSDQASGVYLVKVNANGAIKTMKIIKK